MTKAIDQWLSLLANRDLRRGVALKYWGKQTAKADLSVANVADPKIAISQSCL